jgi:hypothetical protein
VRPDERDAMVERLCAGERSVVLAGEFGCSKRTVHADRAGGGAAAPVAVVVAAVGV